MLTSREKAESIARSAALVLDDLTGGESRSQSRVEVGARLLDDAHALDRDRLLHQVVLRGLAAAAGAPVPTSGRGREALWAQLRRSPDFTPVPDTPVLVCENPRVIEGLAERGIGGWAAVCTSGEPNLVVDKVLGHLAQSSIELRYHGDFDWPGVTTANRAVERYGVVPWRMTVDDYMRAARSDGLRLGDAAVEPVWDSELGAGMRTRDRVVHEESVLVDLLDALGDGR